jgi:hypothetical protein
MTEGNATQVKRDDWMPTLDESISLIITEEMINRRLVYLAQRIDEAYDIMGNADKDWTNKDIAHDLAMAKSRGVLSMSKNANDKPYTIPEKDDAALAQNEDSFTAVKIAEQVLRLARENVKRLETQQSNIQTISSNFRTAIKA